jgi:hypothetical protein
MWRKQKLRRTTKPPSLYSCSLDWDSYLRPPECVSGVLTTTRNTLNQSANQSHCCCFLYPFLFSVPFCPLFRSSFLFSCFVLSGHKAVKCPSTISFLRGFQCFTSVSVCTPSRPLLLTNRPKRTHRCTAHPATLRGTAYNTRKFPNYSLLKQIRSTVRGASLQM